MMLFFNVKSASEARRLFDRPVPRLPTERVNLGEAVGRVTCSDVRSLVDLPEFRRAVVDGFAVHAADTFGASSGLPSYLKVAGEVLMGAAPDFGLIPGHAVRISTGGMLPEGADAIVMVEYTDSTADDLVEIFRPAAPGEGWVDVGDDLRAGALLVREGRRLRPQDLAALAGAGIGELEVYRRPRVAVLPTGDEIVPQDAVPAPGQVRDMNSTALAAAVARGGGDARPYPIVPDDPSALRSALERALAESDLVLIAGGSSVGTRDWTLDTLLALAGAELLLHGVAIRPGKPVILVAAGEKLLVGLPGNPVSALVVFDAFVRPYLQRLTGEIRSLPAGALVTARLTRNCASDPGKEDYVRVRLTDHASGFLAEPLLGKSTLIMTLVEADGMIVIPENVEGLEEGESVEVRLF